MKEIKANLRDIKDSVKSFNIYIFKFQKFFKKEKCWKCNIEKIIEIFQEWKVHMGSEIEEAHQILSF